jgi:hypothetical protein
VFFVVVFNELMWEVIDTGGIVWSSVYTILWLWNLWWGPCYPSFLVLWDVLCYCALFVFVLCLVCPKLPVSLNCPFVIAPSDFSNVYLQTKTKSTQHNENKVQKYQYQIWCTLYAFPFI